MVFFLVSCGQYGPLSLPGAKIDKQHHASAGMDNVKNGAAI
jgi:predicted small lipoprotein YifL